MLGLGRAVNEHIKGCENSSGRNGVRRQPLWYFKEGEPGLVRNSEAEASKGRSNI